MSGNPLPVAAISTVGTADITSVGSNGVGGGKIMTAEELRDAAEVYSRIEADAEFVALDGSYADPTWVTSLASSKITGLAASLAAKADLVAGLVPANQLPSYVDDVIEVADFASLPVTGESGKIYLTIDTLRTYRWSGSVYVELTDATAVWGSIGGSLTSQTDLITYLTTNFSDIAHSHAFSAITSKPSTLAGYGITDAYPLVGNPSGFLTGIADGTVTLAKQADVATATVFYRKSSGSGPPEVHALSTLKTDLGLTGTNSGDQDLSGYLTISAASLAYVSLSGSYADPSWITSLAHTKVTGLGTLATQNGTFSGTSSNTNTGDQTITLTGDVTGSGTGTFAATIANSAVTLAKQADVATATVFYRKTAGTGAPEVQALSTLKTDLGLTGTNSGDQDLSGYLTISAAALAYVSLSGSYADPTWITSLAHTKISGLGTLATQSGTFSGTSSGFNSGDQTITLAGDLSGAGTATITATIANGAVSLAKQADVATATVFYRKTAGTGAPEVQALSTLKTDLGLTGTNSGDQDLSSYLTSATAATTYVPLTRTINSIDLSANRTLAIGTSGTDAAWSGLTLNIPDASATARGLVTTGTQTFAGSKTFTSNLSMVGGITNDNGSIFSSAYGAPAQVRMRRAQGVFGAPTGTGAGQNLGIFGGMGYTNSGAWSSGWCGYVSFVAGETITSSANGGYFTFYTTPIGSTGEVMRLWCGAAGNIGIGVFSAEPTAKLDIDGDMLRLRTTKTPASSAASGNAGAFCWDTTYLYCCTATNTWKRIAWTTF
jgi:hypothetical protein